MSGKRARELRKLNAGRRTASAYEMYKHDFDDEDRDAYGDAPWRDGAKQIFAEADAAARAAPSRGSEDG